MWHASYDLWCTSLKIYWKRAFILAKIFPNATLSQIKKIGVGGQYDPGHTT